MKRLNVEKIIRDTKIYEVVIGMIASLIVFAIVSVIIIKKDADAFPALTKILFAIPIIETILFWKIIRRAVNLSKGKFTVLNMKLCGKNLYAIIPHKDTAPMLYNAARYELDEDLEAHLIEDIMEEATENA